MPPKTKNIEEDIEEKIENYDSDEDIDIDEQSENNDTIEDNDEINDEINDENEDDVDDGTCIYNKDNDNIIEKDDEDDEDDTYANEHILNTDIYVKPQDRLTTQYLTLYERVRVLGDRTSQLSQGAKPMISGVYGLNPKVIAQLELECGMIPIKIIRPL